MSLIDTDAAVHNNPILMQEGKIPSPVNNAKPCDVWCRDYSGFEYSYKEFVRTAKEFHGFGSPGIVLGGAMVDLALRHLPEGSIFDAVCETKKCLPDAIQILTLCSIGNGWLHIHDLGRFSLTFYDKYSGSGIRVSLDAERLSDFTEFNKWFFKLVPKKEQNSGLLMKEIRSARETVLKIQKVMVKIKPLNEKSSCKTVVCPICGEAYPVSKGTTICSLCSGDSYFESI